MGAEAERRREADRASALPFRHNRSSFAVLVAAIAGAAALRIASARYSLWFDELASLFFASRPLAQLWSAWILRETNPPLFYSLLHGWIELFGLGERSTRLPSIFASLLAMTAFHAGMARSFGARAAMVATLLLATSGQQLYFSHQVRAFAFLYLTTTVSFFALLRVVASTVDGGTSRAGWLIYAGGALAGLYLHTTAVLWPVAAVLALMTLDRRFRPGGAQWRALFLANLAVAGGGAWWLGMTWLQLRSPNGDIGWMQGLGAGKTTLVFVATMLQSRQIKAWQAIGPLLIAVLIAVGVVRTWCNERTRLTILLFLWSTALFLLINLRQPIILDRTLFWLSIFPLVLAAIGLASVRTPRVFWVIGAALLLSQTANLALLVPRLEREDWRAAVDTAAGDRQAVVLVEGEAMNVAFGRACAVELGTAPCPFPVITLLAGHASLDGWGRGYAIPARASPDGRLQLPADAHLYVFRRPLHDVLDDLHVAGLARTWPAAPLVEPALVGPLPRSDKDALVDRSRVRAGLARLDRP